MSEREELLALKKLLRKYNIYCLKIHQSGYQERGIPDLLCCIQGRFVGIEGKVIYGNKIDYSDHQKMHLDNIRKAGGIGVGVVICPSHPKTHKWALDEQTTGETAHLEWTSFASLAERVRSLPEHEQATRFLLPSERTVVMSQDDYLAPPS